MSERSIYRAKTLVSMDGPPIDDGAVAIEGEKIVAAGRFSDVQTEGGRVHDLGEMVLLPGLINAHCHLDYTALRGMIAPQRSFADWILQINGLRRDLSDDDYLASIADGFEEAKRWGTTTLVNIESMPALLTRMAPPPLRTWWFAELIDVRPRLAAEEMIAASLHFFFNNQNWRGGFGLSPHAPYTASPRLTLLAADASREGDFLLSTHLAESDEEMEMFRSGSGPLFALLQSLGRSMNDCGTGKTPLGVMLERTTIDERWIIVHLNELTEEDFGLLDAGPRFHIVHCPRSSRYFQHRAFALERLVGMGFNVCLGTDSLASNSSLSLFAEMRTVQEEHPEVSSEQILRMATVNGGRALHQEHALGKIRAGYFADLIALPTAAGGDDVYSEIISWPDSVPWMMLAGRVITPA